jgi:hypothetical protein
MKRMLLSAFLAMGCALALADNLKTYELVSTTTLPLGAKTNTVNVTMPGIIERIVIDNVTAGGTGNVAIARVSGVTSLAALPVYQADISADTEVYPLAYAVDAAGTINSNIMSRFIVNDDALRLIVSVPTTGSVFRVLVTVSHFSE